ncbi:unnamed protein product, partial [Cyprideis torosa]
MQPGDVPVTYADVDELIADVGFKPATEVEDGLERFSDVTFSMKDNRMDVHKKRAEPWTVTLVDTGDNSMTGGRLGRVANYLREEEAFCFTYGD